MTDIWGDFLAVAGLTLRRPRVDTWVDLSPRQTYVGLLRVA